MKIGDRVAFIHRGAIHLGRVMGIKVEEGYRSSHDKAGKPRHMVQVLADGKEDSAWGRVTFNMGRQQRRPKVVVFP